MGEAGSRRDNQDPTLFGQTPSQTVGPYFHYALPWKGGADLVGRSDMGARPDLFDERRHAIHRSSPSGVPIGEEIEVAGRILDGRGDPVPDAMVELWQANAAGRYRAAGDMREEVVLDPHFIGFGRAATDDSGLYRFRTVRPGRVCEPSGRILAAHLALSIFGRGLLKRLATRLYFADGEGNEADPVLAAVPLERRGTIIARRVSGTWWLDIVLQGQRETVFFDL